MDNEVFFVTLERAKQNKLSDDAIALLLRSKQRQMKGDDWDLGKLRQRLFSYLSGSKFFDNLGCDESANEIMKYAESLGENHEVHQIRRWLGLDDYAVHSEFQIMNHVARACYASDNRELFREQYASVIELYEGIVKAQRNTK